jgi:hypothetical protein
MKNIDITQIISPTSKQPFTANSLKFLQDYNAENLASVIKSIITTNLGSYSLTIPYVISGCVVSDAGKDVTAGEIFYGGKYYATTAVNGTTNVARFILTKTQDGVADPLEFTNGALKSVHDIFTYVATDVASGGDFTSANLVSAYKISLSVAPAGFPTTSTSIDIPGATMTTPNDGITRNWLINFKCNPELNHPGGGAFNAVEIDLLIDGSLVDISTSGLAQSSASTFVCCLSISIIKTIAPNKIVKLRFAQTTTNSVLLYTITGSMVQI